MIVCAADTGRAGKDKTDLEPNYRLYTSLTEQAQKKTWAEIDTAALQHNYRLLCEAVHAQHPSTRILAAVKADAYGHGAPACVRALLEQGCDFFAVSCIEEALAVRNVCKEAEKSADILVLGYTQPSLAAQLAEQQIIQTLLSEDYALRLAEEAANAGVTVRVHVAVDTGMNRIGIPAHSDSEILAAIHTVARIASLPHLRVEGSFTHFARADEEPFGEGEAFSDLQAARDRRLYEALEERGTHIPFHHVCNSAAALCRPREHFDGVRFGIALYGFCPPKHIALPLRPVMKLKTVIAHLHPLLPGESVGYGGRFVADSERLLATLPIGYGDGLLRAYTGAAVTVQTANGPRTAPIVGNICMDQCMIDVTDLGAQIGDEVTLFGNDSRELSALAARASTIEYECLCLISARVTRRYINSEK